MSIGVNNNSRATLPGVSSNVPVFFILPSAQNRMGRIKQGRQKNKPCGNRHRVQMGNERCSQCRECHKRESPPVLVDAVQPSVGTPERTQEDGQHGGKQNAVFPRMAAHIHEMEQQQEHHQQLRIELAGILQTDHHHVETRHPPAAPSVQEQRQKDHKCGK